MKQQPIITLLAYFVFAGVCHAACNEDAAKNIRSSSMEDQGKVNMLRAVGCDASEIQQAIQERLKTGLENNRKRNEAVVAKEQVEREAKQKKSVDALNAQIAEDNAKRDEFDQAMADKCGEYPMELKIGMPEKLLVLGCAGQASLSGESYGGRVYRVYGALVSVQKERVVRWVRE